MAKHTQKNDALGMFENTKPIKINTSTAKSSFRKTVEEVVEKNPVVKEEKSEEKAEEKAEPIIKKEETATTAPKSFGNGFQLTMPVEKRERMRRTRSIYMNDEIYGKLVEMSKANNTSVSEYLEFILKQVLFV